MQFIIKTMVSALIIATVSTLSKRLPLFGAIMASLPLTSMLAMIWLYNDTRDVQKVIELSYAIFWIVMPSLVFFLALPMLLKRNFNFYAAMGLSSVVMICSYWIYVKLLASLGVNI